MGERSVRLNNNSTSAPVRQIAFSRGVALFLGLYVALSLVALARGVTHNLNAWWINLSFLPSVLSACLQAVFAVTLLAMAFHVPRSRWLRRAQTAILVLFALFALANSIEVWLLAASGAIVLGFPLPFSFFMSAVFTVLAVALARSRPSRAGLDGGAKQRLQAGQGKTRLKAVLCMALSLVISGACFPLLQVVCFGLTDYRERVDCIVVLGAQVMDDGRLTKSLQNRVDAAIQYYKDGRAPVLIMSGGTGINDVNESEAMAAYAIGHGVAAEDIYIDRNGVNTEHTAENTVSLAQELGFRRIGATSSFYHMARIKMLFLLNGHDVYTMPAPFNINDGSQYLTALREVPGWWYYWFAGVFA
jgi:uncharacterized SAM-binding protein YcdF (DUF218 family)